MKYLQVILILILPFENLILAQTKTEVELAYTITSEELVTSTGISNFDRAEFQSIGIGARTTLSNNTFIKAGLQLKSFGTSCLNEATTTKQPYGTGDYYEDQWIARSIDIPIYIGLYLINNQRIRIGLANGISGGYVFDQVRHDRATVYTLEVYDKHNYHFNSRIDIGVKLNSGIIINISPIWTRQLNSNSIPYQQKGYGGQLSISYDFSQD